MGMFSFAEEEPKGSPLFAAALAGGALGAAPLTDLVDKTLLRPGLNSYRDIMTNSVSLGDPAKALKSKLLDANLRDKLHITLHPKDGNAFYQLKKNYLPSRAEVEMYLREGGLATTEGRVDPIKAIHDMRQVGGKINIKPETGNLATVAHELGHATALNKGQGLRKSMPFRFADSLGRKLQRSGSRGILSAALLAGAFDSEDDTKWLVPGGIALTQAPLLAEEGIASLRGMEALKSLYSKKEVGDVAFEGAHLIPKVIQDNAGKYLRRAWGTYGLGAAGLLAAPLLAMGARSEFDKWSKD